MREKIAIIRAFAIIASLLLAVSPFSAADVLAQIMEATADIEAKVAYCSLPLQVGNDYRYFLFANREEGYKDAIDLKVGEVSIDFAESLQVPELGNIKKVRKDDGTHLEITGSGSFILHGKGGELVLERLRNQVALGNSRWNQDCKQLGSAMLMAMLAVTQATINNELKIDEKQAELIDEMIKAVNYADVQKTEVETPQKVAEIGAVDTQRYEKFFDELSKELKAKKDIFTDEELTELTRKVAQKTGVEREVFVFTSGERLKELAKKAGMDFPDFDVEEKKPWVFYRAFQETPAVKELLAKNEIVLRPISFTAPGKWNEETKGLPLSYGERLIRIIDTDGRWEDTTKTSAHRTSGQRTWSEAINMEPVVLRKIDEKVLSVMDAYRQAGSEHSLTEDKVVQTTFVVDPVRTNEIISSKSLEPFANDVGWWEAIAKSANSFEPYVIDDLALKQWEQKYLDYFQQTLNLDESKATNPEALKALREAKEKISSNEKLITAINLRKSNAPFLRYPWAHVMKMDRLAEILKDGKLDPAKRPTGLFLSYGDVEFDRRGLTSVFGTKNVVLFFRPEILEQLDLTSITNLHTPEGSDYDYTNLLTDNKKRAEIGLKSLNVEFEPVKVYEVSDLSKETPITTEHRLVAKDSESKLRLLQEAELYYENTRFRGELEGFYRASEGNVLSFDSQALKKFNPSIVEGISKQPLSLKDVIAIGVRNYDGKEDVVKILKENGYEVFNSNLADNIVHVIEENKGLHKSQELLKQYYWEANYIDKAALERFWETERALKRASLVQEIIDSLKEQRSTLDGTIKKFYNHRDDLFRRLTTGTTTDDRGLGIAEWFWQDHAEAMKVRVQMIDSGKTLKNDIAETRDYKILDISFRNSVREILGAYSENIRSYAAILGRLSDILGKDILATGRFLEAERGVRVYAADINPMILENPEVKEIIQELEKNKAESAQIDAKLNEWAAREQMKIQGELLLQLDSIKKAGLNVDFMQIESKAQDLNGAAKKAEAIIEASPTKKLAETIGESEQATIAERQALEPLYDEQARKLFIETKFGEFSRIFSSELKGGFVFIGGLTLWELLKPEGTLFAAVVDFAVIAGAFVWMFGLYVNRFALPVLAAISALWAAGLTLETLGAAVVSVFAPVAATALAFVIAVVAISAVIAFFVFVVAASPSQPLLEFSPASAASGTALDFRVRKSGQIDALPLGAEIDVNFFESDAKVLGGKCAISQRAEGEKRCGGSVKIDLPQGSHTLKARLDIGAVPDWLENLKSSIEQRKSFASPKIDSQYIVSFAQGKMCVQGSEIDSTYGLVFRQPFCTEIGKTLESEFLVGSFSGSESSNPYTGVEITVAGSRIECRQINWGDLHRSVALYNVKPVECEKPDRKLARERLVPSYVETQEAGLNVLEGAGKQVELRLKIKTEKGEFESGPFGWTEEKTFMQGDFVQ